MNQDNLRKQTRIAKALNVEYSYKDFAEVTEITDHAFYNWLKGYYDLGERKAKYLEGFIYDLID